MRATENNIRARFICIFVNQSRYKNFQTHLRKENKNENKCSKGKQINKNQRRQLHLLLLCQKVRILYAEKRPLFPLNEYTLIWKRQYIHLD